MLMRLSFWRVFLRRPLDCAFLPEIFNALKLSSFKIF
jgi:hypothetical protein